MANLSWNSMISGGNHGFMRRFKPKEWWIVCSDSLTVNSSQMKRIKKGDGNWYRGVFEKNDATFALQKSDEKEWDSRRTWFSRSITSIKRHKPNCTTSPICFGNVRCVAISIACIAEATAPERTSFPTCPGRIFWKYCRIPPTRKSAQNNGRLTVGKPLVERISRKQAKDVQHGISVGVRHQRMGVITGTARFAPPCGTTFRNRKPGRIHRRVARVVSRQKRIVAQGTERHFTGSRNAGIEIRRGDVR